MRQASSLDFGNFSRITNLPAPINPGDAVNRAFVDAYIEGLNWKDNVRVSTNANVNIAFPGAIVSGVVLDPSDRVHLMGQTNQTENGLYIFNSATSPMVRSKDADTMNKLMNAIVIVDAGDFAGTSWRQVTISGELGTANILFAPFLALTPQATTTSFGTVRLATPSEVTGGTGTGIPNVEQIAQLPSAHVGKKFVFGDGSNNQYTLTHNLNTFDVMVQIRDSSGNRAQVICDNKAVSLNSVVVTSDPVVALNEFTALIVKVV